MDRSSQSAGVTSSAAGQQTTAAKQPTYTTAGTIYNPKSAQPLQPPTRRGRSFKWSHGGAYADLALLPKAALDGLPVRSNHIRSRPVTHQYSPLQQNYDRAVSPGLLKYTELHQAEMMAQISRPDSEAVKDLLPSLLAGSCEDRSDDGGEGDDSDIDSDFVSDPLAGMTVKSLQNLASYPNPSQKRARKALMGARSNVQGMGYANQGYSPSRTVNVGPIGSPSKKEATKAEPDGSNISPTAAFWKSAAGAQCGSSPGPDLDRCSGGNVIEIAEGACSKDSTAESSCSVTGPRPLTAGPPGQRQYRPSTFESTFKALQSKQRLRDYSSSAAGFFSGSLVTDFPAVSAGASHPDVVKSTRASAGNSIIYSGYPATVEPAPLMVVRDDSVWNTLDMGSKQPFLSSGIGHNGDCPAPGKWKDPWIPSVRDDSPESRSRFKPGTDIMSDKELLARNDRIDHWWYSGSGLQNRISTSIGQGDMRSPKADNRHGAVGDGRPTRNTGPGRFMRVAEAIRTPASEHAAPLLGMALVSLARFQKENKPMAQRREGSPGGGRRGQ